MNVHKIIKLSRLIIFYLSFFAFGNGIGIVYANPRGGNVAAGNAVISNPSSNKMQIDQSTNKAIINWQSYNISPNEHVHYQHPNASSITLNRINPNNGASQIYGKLTANGQVWLINPAGIYFGPSAFVNVGGLLATTADIKDQDFMNGNYHFMQSPNWNGAIINDGIIKTAEAGLVALVGSGVVNNGYIEANLGTVVLAAGSEFTVNFSGNDLVGFQVQQDVLSPAYDKNGHSLKNGIANKGTIVSDGGKIMMTARTAGQVLDNAINMQGVLQAKSVGVKNGEIILLAEGQNIVKVSGKIITSGKKNGERGGSIKILGEKVVLVENANLDASGNQGGGEILIGGDYKGKNPNIKNASYTFLDHDVSVNADANDSGDGGKVIVWADKNTFLYGDVSAKGGDLSGDGGFVETSGGEGLDAIDAKIDVSAPNGNMGKWLLDPKNIIVTTSGSATRTQVDQFSDSPTAVLSISPATLNANANVTLQASNDITINSVINNTAGNNRSLTMQAGRSILINANISAEGTINLTANETTANGVINANRDAGAAVITMIPGTTINSVNGNISLLVNTGAGLTNSTSGNITLANITTGNLGNVLIQNLGPTSGSRIVRADATQLITSSSSAIDVNGLGGGGSIGALSAPIRINVANLEARAGSNGIFVAPIANVNVGNAALGSLTGISTAGNLTIEANGAITQSEAIAVNGVSSISAGANPITLTNVNNTLLGAVALNNSGANNIILKNNAALILTTSNVGGSLTATSNNSITLNGNLTANGIELAGQSFINNAGASALNSGSGRFLVWSVNPANDNRNALVYNFKQYNAAYGDSSVLGSGNGFLYTIAPKITPSLQGEIAKTYDGTITATLTNDNYIYAGAVDGDTVVLNNPVSGLYDTKNVGTNKNISVSDLAIVNAANNTATVYGYSLCATTTHADIGTINAASLNINSNEGQSKIYGNDDPGSSPTAYSITSGLLFGSDSLAGNMGRVAGEAVGSYDFVKNTLTVNDGNGGNNYLLAFNGSNNKFQIVSGNLTASIADQNKNYGQNDPSITGIPVLLGNVVNRNVTDMNGNVTTINDTNKVAASLASLSRTAGEDVGSYEVNNASFHALTGAAAGNYNAPVLSGSASLTIQAAPLTASLANQTKVYGNDDPALSGMEVILGGIKHASITTWNGNVTINDTNKVAASLASLSRTAGEDVGSYEVNNASFHALTGAAAGNYNAPVLSGSANLTIQAAPLTASLANQTKVYGNNDPALSGMEVTLGGIKHASITTWNGNVIINDTNKVAASLASLSRTAGEDVGSYEVNDASFHALTGAAAGNYNAPVLSGSASLTIQAAPLTASLANQTKVYGNDDPALSGMEVTLGGIKHASITTWNGNVIINDTNKVAVTLASLSRTAGEDVGSYEVNDASFHALTGASAGNYTAPVLSGSPELKINQASLIITPNSASKIYGNPDPVFTYVEKGLVRNNVKNWMGNITSIKDNLNGSLSRVSGNKVGNYLITQGTLSAKQSYKVYYVNNGASLNVLPATLTTSGGVVENKVYNGTTSAVLNLQSTTLNTVLVGDVVVVNKNGYDANFVSKNIGNNIPVVVSSLVLLGSDADNYILLQPSYLTGSIITSSEVNKNQIDNTFVSSIIQQSTFNYGNNMLVNYSNNMLENMKIELTLNDDLSSVEKNTCIKVNENNEMIIDMCNESN